MSEDHAGHNKSIAIHSLIVSSLKCSPLMCSLRHFYYIQSLVTLALVDHLTALNHKHGLKYK